MRSPVHVRRLRTLFKATALVAVTGLAACSSDATRFEEQLTTATTLTSNQQAIIQRNKPVSQPYPGDEVDETVSARPAAQNTDYSAPEPQPTVKRQPLSAVTATAPKPLAVAEAQNTATEYRADNSRGVVLQPRKTEKPKLRLVGVDQTSTGTVAHKPRKALEPVSRPVTETAKTTTAPVTAKTVEAKPDGTAKNGWTKAGGTWVTIGSGETLYNLSRRFGVPVRAIMSANNITDAKSVNAGSKVLIPTYNFSASAPVSAPDNNPKTKAARASRGFQGQVRNGKVATPKQRLAKTETVDPITTGSLPEKTEPREKPVKRAEPETTDIATRATEVVKTAKKTSSGAFRWPAQGRILKNFGERKRSGANDGIDISVPVGTPVKASENGTVIYSGSELEEFGNLILISHANGWVTAYGNASSRLVKRGDKVRRGQVIAKSGKSGNATVPQLHFELRKDSRPVNPLKHLAKG